MIYFYARKGKVDEVPSEASPLHNVPQCPPPPSLSLASNQDRCLLYTAASSVLRESLRPLLLLQQVVLCLLLHQYIRSTRLAVRAHVMICHCHVGHIS